MAFIAVSGEPGCRHEELARMAAQRLQCELITDSDLVKLIAAQFGQSGGIVPDKAWRPLAASIVASLGLEHPNLVVCCMGAEMLLRDLPAAFRFHVVAPESIRLANLISDGRLSRKEAPLSRKEAKTRLRKM